MAEVKSRKKCPHCGQPVEITVDVDVSQSVRVSMKGVSPVASKPKAGEAEEA